MTAPSSGGAYAVVLSTETFIEVVQAKRENGEGGDLPEPRSSPPTWSSWTSGCPRSTGSRGGPRAIRDAQPVHPKIIMLTVSDEDDDLYEAIKAGANSYLLKEVSVE